MKLFRNFKRLKGDASSRIFFRNKIKNPSSIIIYAKKNKKSNLLNYDCINKILIRNKILAPKLLSENYSKNYIEVQDFGNQTIFSVLKKGPVNKIKMYKKIIELLNKLQLIQQRKIKNFKNKIYSIPTYSPKILEEEAKLFSDWYIDKKLNHFEKKNFKKKYYRILKDLIKKIHLKNNTFVHRDFHISNLMIVNNEIGVIDSQDALIGNKAYDLASLIDDVRFENSENLKREIFNYYVKKNKISQKNFFKNDFEIITVLRNLKIIGIFTRLAVRDNKKKYLKLIPHAWKLIKARTKNNKKFRDLNFLLNINKVEN